MVLTKAEIKNLKDKKHRKENGLFLVEGNKFCADLDKSLIVKTITTNKTLKGYPNICLVDNKTLMSLASTVTPQEIICVCKIKKPPQQIVGDSVVLDEVQDPGNVGTLIRSALAFNFKNIILIDSADAYSEKVIRSSAGTIFKCNIYKFTKKEFLTCYKDLAECYIVADMQGENIANLRLPSKRIAVIIGNEGNGVSAELMSLSNKKVSIPMSSEVESLNAGVAGSIIMQRIMERRK